MSIYKGTQLIAANGAPGSNGADGRNGTDAGVMIDRSFTELHNNLDPNGVQEVTNTSINSRWSSVGGYRSSIINVGQGSIVFGYGNSLKNTQSASVFGYSNNCSQIGQGGLISGYDNTVDSIGQGSVVFGYDNNCSQIGQGGLISGYNNTVTFLGQGSVVFGTNNTVNATSPGFTILGMEHDLNGNMNMSDAGIIAGYNVTKDSTLPTMPRQKAGYESTDLIRIGLKYGSSNGEVGIRVRNDGCVGISGDLAFRAVDSDGSSLGTYTLGGIVKALQNAGISIPTV